VKIVLAAGQSVLVLLCSCSDTKAMSFPAGSCAQMSVPATGVLPQASLDRLERWLIANSKESRGKSEQRTERGGHQPYVVREFAGKEFFAEIAALGSGEHVLVGCMVPTSALAAEFEKLVAEHASRGEWEATFSNPEATALITLQAAGREFCASHSGALTWIDSSPE
jgi:hypothetical protein